MNKYDFMKLLDNLNIKYKEKEYHLGQSGIQLENATSYLELENCENVDLHNENVDLKDKIKELEEENKKKQESIANLIKDSANLEVRIDKEIKYIEELYTR